ncbi:hypothetical protein CEXT_202831 [Caerostris extrusa]|uniref:Uncharacterized protein n=1 Tax=Caerostris extrusa TaxID=172846 RepID=A0AAV4UQC4_CAEEX|nr:hypothetical protein CEXT_202831 [Caerostris extrusa]
MVNALHINGHFLYIRPVKLDVLLVQNCFLKWCQNAITPLQVVWLYDKIDVLRCYSNMEQLSVALTELLLKMVADVETPSMSNYTFTCRMYI